MIQLILIVKVKEWAKKQERNKKSMARLYNKGRSSAGKKFIII